MTRAFEAVLWDMDGTLVDSEPLHEQALIGSLLAEGLAPTSDMHSLVLGKSAPGIYAVFCERFGLRLSFERWIALYYGLYLDKATGLRPREGALEVYSDLAAAGVPQVIVSNSDRMIVDANLRVAGITRPGLCSVSRNDVRVGKPDPEPFLRAAWLVGVDPRKAVVVEDSPTGAAAGLAAGMRTLFWPQAPMTGPAGAEAIGAVDQLRAALEIGHAPAEEEAFLRRSASRISL